jgi:hypothetical protein
MGKLRPGLLAMAKGRGRDKHTVNTNTHASDKASDSLAVAIVLPSQVAGRVLGELVCGSNTGCTPN